MMRYTTRVVQEIEVTVDETKFDEAFMEEFRESFYQFFTLEEHEARGQRGYQLWIVSFTHRRF